jgi:hypothetical protein
MPKRNLLVSLISILVVASGLFIGNTILGNKPSLGLDLQGGASVTMTPVGEYEEDALSVAVDIIRQRVDAIGVAEPEIIRQGDTVVVNLPGVKDQQQALDLIGRTGSVEMRPVLRTAENPENTTTTTAAKGATTTTVTQILKPDLLLVRPCMQARKMVSFISWAQLAQLAKYSLMKHLPRLIQVDGLCQLICVMAQLVKISGMPSQSSVLKEAKIARQSKSLSALMVK